MESKLKQIADAYEKAFFERHPEIGMYWGRTDIPQDRFMDHSMSALQAWHNQEDIYLRDLKALDETALHGTPEHLTYQLLKETLENNQAARICHDELWNVNPLWGWHNILTMLAEKQPIGTPEYRALALTRWRSVETVVFEEIKNLRLGLSEGYSAPKPVIQRVLKQFHLILNASLEDSPFIDFAKRDSDPQFKRQMVTLLEQSINPALKHYANILEEEYLPKARDKIGISALPMGGECYLAKIRKETTLAMQPQDIYAFGLDHMQQLYREVAKIGQAQCGIQDMAEVFWQIRHNPKYFFHSEQDLLQYNYAALEKAIAKTPAWFDLMPKAPGTLKPYPLHRAQTGAAGEYHAPSEDGKRPGIFYINTFEAHMRSRIDQEATLYHELIPGHHYQVALAFENKSQHSLDKYLWNSGFGEGWALYVERLADEMGLYHDDISRLGMLSNEALRTARLVVDPGIHVMNWTREQAVDYLKKHTALDEIKIEAEVDRYIMNPGQATAYMLGKREIDNLRQLAKNKLKNRFDVRIFHNQVLKHGAVTLPMLRDQIEHWLASMGE